MCMTLKVISLSKDYASTKMMLEGRKMGWFDPKLTFIPQLVSLYDEPTSDTFRHNKSRL